MKKIKCQNCGAEYTYEEEKLIFRDNDSYECRCCGDTLMSWNESVIPTKIKLLKKPIADENLDAKVILPGNKKLPVWGVLMVRDTVQLSD